MGPKQLIPARMDIISMEETKYENAYVVDTGLARSHNAGDVRYITYGSCEHKPSQKGSIHFCI